MNTKYNGNTLASRLAFASLKVVDKLLQILNKFICNRSPGTVHFQGSTGINIMNCFLPSS